MSKNETIVERQVLVNYSYHCMQGKAFQNVLVSKSQFLGIQEGNCKLPLLFYLDMMLQLLSVKVKQCAIC